MLSALLADLAVVQATRPGYEIEAVLDGRIPVRVPARVRTHSPAGGPPAALQALLPRCDAAWLVAPESGGRAARLAALAEAAGVVLLGSTAAAIRRCSDKRSLAAVLSKAGIPTPRTMAPERAAEGEVAFPVVVKPHRGAGSRGVTLARTPAELRAAVAALPRGRALVQEYLSGVPASVALLAHARGAVPLAVSLQTMAPGPRFRYRGGETPLDHPLAERARCNAAAACALVPGLRGWVGVDVVLTGAEAYVVEINPRLTTSFLGVRAALDANVAELALRACAGGIPDPPPLRRRVRFDAAGRVRVRAALGS